MDIASLAFWAIALYAFVNRGPALIYVFFAALSFETVAVVPPALMGGVSLTPGWVTAGLLATKVLLWRSRPLLAFAPLADFRRLGLLALCCAYGVMSAYFFPRLFAGTPVIAVRVLFTMAVPLTSTSSNLTQSFYFVLSTLVVLTFYQLGKHPEARRHILNAILVGGVFAIVTGAVDWATTRFGAAGLLAPLRTATYALLTNDLVLTGTRRVVGITPEASAYAGLCMAFAAPIFFLRDAYQQARTRRAAMAVFLGLLGMIALSTSSTGLIGIAVLTLAALAFGFRQSWSRRRTGGQSLVFVSLAFVAGVALVALDPGLAARAADQVNQLVFQKSGSVSYAERSTWNDVALQAAQASHWLGVGLGSVRASSWLVAIVSNIGIPGAVLMFGFLTLVATASPLQPNGREAEIVTGAKFALLPLLAMMSLSGTLVSLDPMPSLLLGLIGALGWRLSHAEESAPAAPAIAGANVGPRGALPSAAGLRTAR